MRSRRSDIEPRSGQPAPFDGPAAALAVGPLPAAFRHPQADREVRLDGHLVAYALQRARRRSIGFVVGPEGLSVKAPRWVGLGEIDAALGERARWVLRKLKEQQARAARLQSARVDWRDGATLPYLGRALTLALDPRAALDAGDIRLVAEPGALPDPRVALDADGVRLDAELGVLLDAAPATLHIGLSPNAGPGQLRDAVQGWLQRQARAVFEERCGHYAARLGVTVRRLSLSSAQTRWGSASADGSIRLNWRLVHFALPSIDYVVAHELAHLREMNHSPRFWAVVRSVLPDYEAARRELKDGVVPVFD